MTYDDLWRPLSAVCGEGEARAIVRYVLDVRFGLSAADVYCGKVTQLSADRQHELGEIMRRLMQAEPVQYVLGEADFCGRAFAVEPGVLIPRPETEDLCRWMCDDAAARGGLSADILDIGTGSGCIAATLALEMPAAEVYAADISEQALAVAAENARALGARVVFRRADALKELAEVFPEPFDVLVSNPPYVPESDRAGMHANVRDHEPALALFVPDDDRIRFYRAIARAGQKMLRPGGRLYFEIYEHAAEEVVRMLDEERYTDTILRRDLFGKPRMICSKKRP